MKQAQNTKSKYFIVVNVKCCDTYYLLKTSQDITQLLFFCTKSN